MTWIGDNAIAARKHFDSHPDEEQFIKYFGEVFQVTYARSHTSESSTYSYYYLKAYSKPAHNYGLSGEIVALYAPYHEVQARSIIEISRIQQENKERIHPVWSILITDDPDTVNNLEKLTAGKDLETYTIPFSRQELEARPSAQFIYERLEKFIRGRDLFAFQSGLQSDIFFFGRQSLVDKIIGQTENGQNFGLFGLRKIGKTSVLLAVERYLSKLGTYRIIHVDCQQAGFYLRRWDSLLAWISSELSGREPEFLGEAEQATRFGRIVQDCPQKILLVFDEIENISFGLSQAKHWNEDFLPFWGTIRAVHQTTGGKLTFGVAGVNPHIFNVPIIGQRDNPILLGVSPLFLWPLDSTSVREMVRTIGRFMGLQFEEDVYSWLSQQYGGHPFLVRKACSLIYNKSRKKTGEAISLDEFTSRQKWLDEQLGKDILNILVVLGQYYPDEFEHLMILAQGDIQWLQDLRREAPEDIEHILEYRIISENEDGAFSFVIESLKRYLEAHGSRAKLAISELTASSNPTEYGALPQTEELEFWTRISIARNKVEPKLRNILHQALKFHYGERTALHNTLTKFSTHKQASLEGYSLGQLFNGESKALYLKDLKEIALREWDLVKHVFGNNKKAFEFNLDLLNSIGRSDTHANPIAEPEVTQIEAISKALLDQMKPYLNE